MTLFDYDAKVSKRADLARQMEAADFWNDPDAANATIEEFRLLKTQTEGLEQAIGMLEDGQTALEMASEDEEFLAEADETLYTLEQHMEKVEYEMLIAGTFLLLNCAGYQINGNILMKIRIGKLTRRLPYNVFSKCSLNGIETLHLC